MELMETQDPDKRRLIEISDRRKREVEKELKAMTEKTERILTNALIIGGSLALTYILIRQFSGSKSKKKKGKGKPTEEVETTADDGAGLVESSMIVQIGTKILNEATLILLDIAKEKLFEYLASRKQKNENS